MLHIQSVELKNRMTIYWLGHYEKPGREYGICFEGENNCIARSGIAESVCLLADMGEDMKEVLKEGLTPEEIGAIDAMDPDLVKNIIEGHPRKRG